MTRPILTLFLAVLIVPAAWAQAPDEAPPAAEATTDHPEGVPAEAPAADEAAAPEAAAEADAPKPPPGFEKIEGKAPAQAEIKAPPLVIVSYLTILIGLVGYVLFLWRKQSNLRAELTVLARRLDEAE